VCDQSHEEGEGRVLDRGDQRRENCLEKAVSLGGSRGFAHEGQVGQEPEGFAETLMGGGGITGRGEKQQTCTDRPKR
jgi:hypothetical protein